MAALRTYTVEFAGVSVSVVQDLFNLICGASMAVELHGIVIGQITGATVQNLRFTVKRFSGGYSNGSGGSAPTPQLLGRGDHAATVTSHVNDTTQASGGTSVVLHSDVINTVNGYQFFWPKEDRPNAGLNEGLVISLDSAPTSAMTMSGTLYFAELI